MTRLRADRARRSRAQSKPADGRRIAAVRPRDVAQRLACVTPRKGFTTLMLIQRQRTTEPNTALHRPLTALASARNDPRTKAVAGGAQVSTQSSSSSISRT